jgi:hypothetical protein
MTLNDSLMWALLVASSVVLISALYYGDSGE